MNRKNKKKSLKTSWQDQEPNSADKEVFKSAVVQYALERDRDAKEISHSLQ